MKKICLIDIIGAHYRFPIYAEMNKVFGCDFYLGDKTKDEIKQLAYDKLPGFKKRLHNVFLHNFYWQCGALKLIFQPYKYYILNGEPYCLSSWAMLICGKLFGKKTISWSHGWYGRETAIKRIIKKMYFSLFDKLMIYNEYAIRLMEREGFNRHDMFCIANSLDSDREKMLRNSLSETDIYKSYFNNDNPTIIYCGRIQQRKKLDLLLEAMRIMKQRNLSVNAVFVGKDVDNVSIPQIASNLGVGENVWMYGACYDDKKLAELFYNASACVSPGNIGLTAIHSLSFGCPCVTHNNFAHQMPEFETILPGKTGDFFEYDSAESLADVIEKWICLNSEQRDIVRKSCFAEIDRKWNIHYQIDVINKVING
jgi:glycosyltransferase involved in cell wall biosynthesis